MQEQCRSHELQPLFESGLVGTDHWKGLAIQEGPLCHLEPHRSEPATEARQCQRARNRSPLQGMDGQARQGHRAEEDEWQKQEGPAHPYPQKLRAHLVAVIPVGIFVDATDLIGGDNKGNASEMELPGGSRGWLVLRMAVHQVVQGGAQRQ